MPSMGKLMFASLGVAGGVSVVTPKPTWVLSKVAENCETACNGQSVAQTCDADRPWPQSQGDFETILDNIDGQDVAAECSAYVDLDVKHKSKFEGPAIDKGVCWYYTKATEFAKCKENAGTTERRVCVCNTDKTKWTPRAPIPHPIPYPTMYKRAEKASISFTIKFPFFTQDAFECLEAQAGKEVTGSAKKHPEAFFKMADGIRQSLGTKAASIHFVAPEAYSDPLEAKVDVYAAPEDMSGAELFLAKSKIRAIGPYLVEKYPELKMCAPRTSIDKFATYETEFGQRPVFPQSVTPTGSWSPARKEEISNDSRVLALGVDLRSLGVASAGVLLVVGGAVLWRHRQERELVSTLCE